MRLQVLLQRKSNCPTWDFEQNAQNRGYKVIAGIDEAGRGPLAGPVVAASCILLQKVDGLNDSKLLTSTKRLALFEMLKDPSVAIFSVGVVSSEEIDEINILQATKKAMTQSVLGLSCRPDYLLVDGLKLSYNDIPSEKIIKGDRLSLSIAAASIIAKETRDQIMLEYHQKWPDFGFDRHKGYGTAKHLEALQKFGPCPIHRKSFQPVADYSLS